VTRASIRDKLHGASLRRLSVAFADPLRLKIVTELYMREMSPTSFFEQFGGGSAARVNRHFKRLAEHGWLELVRTETGGRRRGAVERFYRTTELAVVDLETWTQLPEPVRVAFTCRTFEQLAERVGDAISAGTFDARADRHLTWTPLLLDQTGWEQLIAALDAIFELLFDEMERARGRIAVSGEVPILTTVALAGFESPVRPIDHRDGPGRSDRPAGEDAASPFPISHRLSKVFGDPLDLQIITELSQREMSPKEFFDEFGGRSLSDVSRHFKQLEALGWLKLKRTETGGRRRGAIEHFYVATGPAVFDIEHWTAVPTSARAKFSWRTFEQFGDQVRLAIEQRTIDARCDRHFTWSLLLLDRQGWERVIALLDGLFDSLPERQKEAEARLAESGEEPIRMTVALAAFESPKDSTKAP
jgi:DNA-binding transcriptional ArsR family regulator